MDCKLIPIVLFVALCCMSVGTYAQSDTPADAPANSNSTTNGTTTNSTVAPVTNVTAVTSNVTTPAPITTAPPLVPNTVVADLPTAINRDGCGSTRLCAAEPSSCDPSVAGSCFFLGAKQTSGRNFEFSLSGETEGFLAASLSTGAGGNDTVYICAKNKSAVTFIPAFLNSGKFIRGVVLPVNTVKGKLNGNKIQCTFAATVPNATARAADTAFALGVLTGSYNDTADSIGTPVTQIKSTVLDLSVANQTVTNIANTTTPNTASTITLQHSVSQALLIVLGVLSLSML